MGKYLIQDILPPGRKHAASAKKVIEHTPVHEKIIMHTKKSIHHDTPLSTEVHRKAHHPHSAAAPVSDIDFHDAHPMENPHTMIYEQLADTDEDDSMAAIHNPPLALTDEIIVGSEAPGAWPYNNNNILTSSQGSTSSFRHTPSAHFSQGGGVGSGSKGGSWLPWIFGPLVLMSVLLFLFNFFSGATITLIAKASTTPLDQQFTAIHKDKAGETLAYSVISTTTSETIEVPATGTKTVTTKAVGKIIIYNEQATAQRLIKNTRFQSTAGKIYRINESITVPKAVTKSGKTTIGSLEITIYADEAGAEYNSPATDFSVPGLKNTPQAKMVYARSKGIIAGGASGTTKSVSDQDLKKANDDLRIALETKLRNKAHAELSGFAGRLIAYDQGIVVDLKDSLLSSEKATSDDKAVVTETGTIFMLVFERSSLTNVIARAVVPSYGGEDVALVNLENLTFGVADLTVDVLTNKLPIDFSLKGTPELKWLIDQDAVRTDLLGLLKSDFNSKMAAYPTIERAKASVRPFWKQRFPTDPKAISINLVEQISD